MANGNKGDAILTDVMRELRLPDGEYIVIDELGHEAFVPRRMHRERERVAVINAIGDDD